ncbi:MAG: hypothetical protein AAFQ63_19810 [Cyanobacteria bacterium J06621_11]
MTTLLGARGKALEKLRIYAYENEERTGIPYIYEVMFNPESYSFTYVNTYNSSQCPSTSDNQADYTGTEPRDLKLKLIVDDTSAMAGLWSGKSLRPMGKTVPQRVEDFLDLTTRLYGDSQGSRYLQLTWGEMEFDCRVKSVQVNYTLFNRKGVATRAELDVAFIEDVKKHPVGSAVSSGLTNVRTLWSGFSLPLLSAAIYATANYSANYYVQVARANRLNSLRGVKPGTRLVFPPVSKTSSRRRS